MDREMRRRDDVAEDSARRSAACPEGRHGAGAVRSRTDASGLRAAVGSGVVLDAIGLACYIAYSYLFWDSPLLLDRVHFADGGSVAHYLLLVQGVFTGIAALALMLAWGKAAPLRHNGALVATMALAETLAVALACGGWGDASVACSLVGFGLSGAGSAMRLGWEERFSVRGVPAVAIRAALAYLLGTVMYVVTILACDAASAMVVTGVLPMVSLILLLWRSQQVRGRDVRLPDPSIEPLGPQQSLRECFARVPWRIPAFVALSYACFGATRMNMLADSLVATSVYGALTPAFAMVACATGICLAYVSYRHSVQAGICIAVPIMTVAGIVNLLGGAGSSVAILLVTNIGVEITKYIMLFLMVDVIVKDGAPALMCLAMIRFAMWMGSALGQAVADALPGGTAVLVVILLALMAALMVTIGGLPRSVSSMFAGGGAGDSEPDLPVPAEAAAPAAPLDAPSPGEGRASEDAAPARMAAAPVESVAPVSLEGLVDAVAQRFGLSPREHEVLAIWVTGRPAEYVERTLFISKSTVKTHLTHIYAKTGTANRAELLELFEEIRVTLRQPSRT